MKDSVTLCMVLTDEATWIKCAHQIWGDLVCIVGGRDEIWLSSHHDPSFHARVPIFPSPTASL